MRAFGVSVILGGVVCLSAGAAPQNAGASTPPADDTSMQEHYRSAIQMQASGDVSHAKSQYQAFLSEALDRIASDLAQAGEYPKAVPLFEQALLRAPQDRKVWADYAEAALIAGDITKAKHFAQQVAESEPKDAKAHLLLGRVLLKMNDNRGARREFETAVALDPNFDDGYALATADLALADIKDASNIFREMQTGLGDTAALHMQFGLAYGNADDPEQAIHEFRKVIAKDPKFPGAHYSLGASYLRRSGDTDFPQAEAEFHKELAYHPNDSLSYSQLGYIAMAKHKLPEAVAYLSRAVQLNPQDADSFLLLGQIYGELGKRAEAESALRSAIAVTHDPSRNHYQIRGAHYQLGRLLIESGRVDEGKKEMKISEELLLKNKALDKANVTGNTFALSAFPGTTAAPVDPQLAAQVKAFEKQLSPAIADSYNNLGVIAAMEKNYPAAAADFEQSAHWNPTVPGANANWGRAAFAAHLYAQAADPLQRHLAAHPEDESARSMLGVTRYMLGQDSAALQTLQPLRGHMDASPALSLVYAKLLVRTGDLQEGIEQLKTLEGRNPDSALVHQALQQAYARNNQPEEAEREGRIYQTMTSTTGPAAQPAKSR
ncbi:MAG TPA: tetratricopeptide repeat protein [Acidobacteriaceae bacterium]|nr:tetratricopeptide repeat protein [Acidobacteriaceae bacterium]